MYDIIFSHYLIHIIKFVFYDVKFVENRILVFQFKYITNIHFHFNNKTFVYYFHDFPSTSQYIMPVGIEILSMVVLIK